MHAAAKLDAQCRAARMRLKDFDTPAEHRWSELVPPRTALTFAAIWDEDEGMVTFTGARLLDSEADKARTDRPSNDNSPSDIAFTDDQSQILTIDRYAVAISDESDEPPSYPGYPLPSAGVDSLAFARDALADADTYMDSRSCLTRGGGLRVPNACHGYTAPDSPAVASSMALASLAHVPFRRTLMNNPFRRSRESRPRVQDIRVYARNGTRRRDEDVRSAGSDVTDEGFYEDHRLTTGTFGSAPVLVEVNLSSAFSVTTTSTSRYVEVDHPSQAEQYSCEEQQTCVESASRHSSSWSTLRDAERNICFNVPLELGRRLKKARLPRSPLSAESERATPADPAEVLARRTYNHATSPTRTTMSDASTWSGSGLGLGLGLGLGSTNGVHGKHWAGCGGGAAAKASLRRTKSLLHRVVPCGKKHEDGDDRWVYVEVEHKVKQRVCAVCV